MPSLQKLGMFTFTGLNMKLEEKKITLILRKTELRELNAVETTQVAGGAMRTNCGSGVTAYGCWRPEEQPEEQCPDN